MAEPPAADASPLIVLAQADLLSLLAAFGGEIIVPQAVADEVRRAPADDPAVRALETGAGFRVVEPLWVPSEIERLDLGAGEAAALTWARAHPGTLAIIDERRGRRAAAALGVPTVGVLGVITQAKRAGIVQTARPVAEKLLRESRWYIARSLLDHELRSVGE